MSHEVNGSTRAESEERSPAPTGQPDSNGAAASNGAAPEQAPSSGAAASNGNAKPGRKRKDEGPFGGRNPFEEGFKNGRDPLGRFAPGNPGGPGNPYGRRIAVIRRLMMMCVSDEDICAITQKLVERAKNGEESAIRLLFQYVIGTPTPAPNPDREDHEEFELRRERPTYMDLHHYYQRVPISLTAAYLRATDPMGEKWLARFLGEGVVPNPIPMYAQD
jgi:hypothetical protein